MRPIDVATPVDIKGSLGIIPQMLAESREEKSSAADPGTRRVAGWLVLALIVLAAVRIWYGSVRELLPDEATYWAWSRHLAGGYLDHPPMVAFLIHVSTSCLGHTELAVRAPAAILAVGAAAVILALCGRIWQDRRITFLAALILLGSPLLNTLGTIHTPDTSAIFFSAAALAAAVGAVRRADSGRSPAGFWLLFGVFCGLALLSKYTTVLLPASVFAALATAPGLRSHLRRPWFYLAGLVALAIFSPTIWWNYKHEWVSFAYQFGHGLKGKQGDSGLSEFSEYVGGQFLLWTPILLVLGVMALAWHWPRYRSLPGAVQLHVWAATVPIVFFGLAATRSHAEINWPGFAYFPLTALTAAWVVQIARRAAMTWARIGCGVALAITVVMHVPEAMAAVRAPMPRQMKQLTGWRRLAQQVAAESGSAVIVCNRHQDANELAFYLPGQPEVPCVSIDSRVSAHDFMDDRPDLSRFPRIVFVSSESHTRDFCRVYGFVEEGRRTISVPVFNQPKGRVREIAFLRRSSGSATRPLTTEPAP